jgi:type 1 glutamine amidotransferase
VTSAAGERHRARRRTAALGLVGLVVLGLGAGRAGPALPRLLMVTHSAGYEHEVVRRPGGLGLSTAERVVADLARRSGCFEVTHVATRAELAGLTVATVRAHQALLFFTTGELPLAPAVRQAIFQRVREGAGFIGVHSATDTWYAVPEYHQLVGATFDGHPWHGRVRVVVEDRMHPAMRHLGDAFEISDEIYQFRDWSRERVHVLARLDPRSVDVGRGKRPDHDYALAWSRQEGEGRVVYTALGHEPAVWADERFRIHLLGAIEWALRSC